EAFWLLHLQSPPHPEGPRKRASRRIRDKGTVHPCLPHRHRAAYGTITSNSGGYCCAPNTSCSPGLPLGFSRLIVNLMAFAGSNTTKSVMRAASMLNSLA